MRLATGTTRGRSTMRAPVATSRGTRDASGAPAAIDNNLPRHRGLSGVLNWLAEVRGWALLGKANVYAARREPRTGVMKGASFRTRRVVTIVAILFRGHSLASDPSPQPSPRREREPVPNQRAL